MRSLVSAEVVSETDVAGVGLVGRMLQLRVPSEVTCTQSKEVWLTEESRQTSGPANHVGI